MSRYLKNLLAQSVDQVAEIRPRLGSRFEEMSLAGFSGGEAIGGSFFQEQSAGIQPHGTGEQKEHTLRSENVSLENKALVPAGHEDKEVPKTRVLKGGRAGPISEEKRSVGHDLQLEGKGHDSAFRARKGPTGRQELGKSSGNISPLLDGKRTETVGSTVQVGPKTTILQQKMEPVAPLSSSPDRERAGRQNRSDHLTAQQDMVDAADRNLRKVVRDTLLIRPQPAEKPGRLEYGVEQATRLQGPDIPEGYGKRATAPPVQITIGRIEIRAAGEKKQPPREISKPAAPQRPALSLDEYLSQRSERGR